MDIQKRLIDHLHISLEARKDIYAFWIEGSVAQGHADEFSDIDLWLSTDDQKNIYHL